MDRPYCIEELRDIDTAICRKYRLSDEFVQHVPCMHRYRVRKGGRKEEYVKGTDGILNDQTCSICFKQRITDNDGWSPDLEVSDIITRIVMRDGYPGNELDKKFLDEKDLFYKWLYIHNYT